MLGWLGVFLTGSDTSANALFGNLQVVTANALGLIPILTACVNSAAGVMGKMISVQSIAVAVAATGMSRADAGRLFRFTIKHSVLPDDRDGPDFDAVRLRVPAVVPAFRPLEPRVRKLNSLRSRLQDCGVSAPNRFRLAVARQCSACPGPRKSLRRYTVS